MMKPQMKRSTGKRWPRPVKNKKVPQAVERTRRRPTGVKWFDVKKVDGRHRSRLVAKKFFHGIFPAMYPATPPLEAWIFLTAACERERRDTKVAPDANNISVMIHVDVHRAHVYAQAKPNTCVEVIDEDQLEGGNVWVLGQGDVRDEASVIGVAGRSGEVDARSKHESRSTVAVCFYLSDVEGSGLVHDDDFVIVMCRWHAKEIEKHVRSKWDVEVMT